MESVPASFGSISGRTIKVIGVPLDLGQQRRGVDMGPSAVRVAGLEAKLEALGHVVEDHLDRGSHGDRLERRVDQLDVHPQAGLLVELDHGHHVGDVVTEAGQEGLAQDGPGLDAAPAADRLVAEAALG